MRREWKWRKTTLMKLLEARQGQPIDQLLSRLHTEQGMTLGQIAEFLDIDIATVSRWMERMGIPVGSGRSA